MDTKLVSLILAVSVGIIMIGTLLAPFVASTQTDIGDSVTYTNTTNSTNAYNYDYVDSVSFSATYDSAWTDITVNEQSVSALSGDSMLAIVSDGMSLQITTGGAALVLYYSESTSSVTLASSEGTITITFEDGDWTIVGGTSGTLYSGEYTWVVTFVEDGDYIAYNDNPTNVYNSGSASDFIIYGSVYTTGDLDTYYSYGNGSVTLGVSTYSGTVNLVNTLVDGTTDVYKCTTCNVTITDEDSDSSETFTPYRCLVKETVTGHESGGASYSILGIVPVVMILALLMMVIPYITKRDE